MHGFSPLAAPSLSHTCHQDDFTFWSWGWCLEVYLVSCSVIHMHLTTIRISFLGRNSKRVMEYWKCLGRDFFLSRHLVCPTLKKDEPFYWFIYSTSDNTEFLKCGMYFSSAKISLANRTDHNPYPCCIWHSWTLNSFQKFEPLKFLYKCIQYLQA